MSDYVPGVYRIGFSDSDKKKIANTHVRDIFAQQGLEQCAPHSAIIMILDTYKLLTTDTLLEKYRDKIGHIIIVEKNESSFKSIIQALESRKDLDSLDGIPKISVIYGDVFQHLIVCKYQIEYIWLDLLEAQIKKEQFEMLRLWSPMLKCLAITFAVRARTAGSVKGRINKIHTIVSSHLPYKLMEYGYRSTDADGELGQPMHLTAFGRNKEECKYYPIHVSPIKNCTDKVEIWPFNYPNRTQWPREKRKIPGIIVSGTLEEWQAKCQK
jgi:hypothetical protein